MRIRLLIVHSEEKLLTQLRRGLRAQSYEVRIAASRNSALDLVRSWMPHVVLTEFDGSGPEFRQFQQRLKAAAGAQLIAMLGSRPGKLRIAALGAGADDYIACPITMPELIARIALAVERGSSSAWASTRRFETADLLIDVEQMRVLTCGEERHFAAKEFELLRCLLLNANRPVEHADLLHVLGMSDSAAGKNLLRVYIRQLRKKLEPQPGKPHYIRTVARVGYRFHAAPANNAFLMSV